MYLLDTNICIYLINKTGEEYQNIINRLIKHKKAEIYLSIVTVAELYYGAENSSKKESNLKLMNAFIDNFQIANLDKKASINYAQIRTKFNKINRKIGDMDMLIGAIALANDMILVTNNEKDFIQIDGLKIENWAK